MSENNKLTSKDIPDRIYVLRHQRIMLDRDLAELYQVETRALIQAVKRNISRFPADFMFTLSSEELSNLRSHFVISSWGGRRYASYAFTEQGVAMLSSVLKSERAAQVNIQIMRAFVQLRHIVASHSELSGRIDDLEQKYDGHFKIVFDAIREIMTPLNPPDKRRIGF